MKMGLLILALVLISATIIRNDSLALAAALLLLLQAAGNGGQNLVALLEQHSVQWGIFLLLLAVLAPLGRVALSTAEVYATLFSLHGLVAVAVGALSAYLAAQGLDLLHLQPSTMLGLVVGSILGVALLGGIPAGPLVAAGLTAVASRWLTGNR